MFPTRYLLVFALFISQFSAASPRAGHADFVEAVVHRLGHHPRVTNARDAIERLDARADGAALVTAATLPAESRSVARMAASLRTKYGYRLLLIPGDRGVATPVFSGLILDTNDDVVANFVLVDRARHARRSYVITDDQGRQIMGQYRPHEWFQTVFGNDHITPDRYESALIEYGPRIEVIAELAAIFGVGTDRPTWILVDAPLGLEDKAALLESAKRATQKFTRLDAVVFGDEKMLFTVRGAEVRSDPLAALVSEDSTAAQRPEDARPLIESYLNRARAGLRGDVLINTHRPHDEPGLIISGKPPRAKVDGVRRLARILHEQFGLTLYLIADDQGGFAPAIDGLVLGPDRTVMANFAHAHLPVREPHRVLESLANEARRYASLDAWIDHVAWTPKVLKKDRLRQTTEHRLDFLARASLLYALDSGRATWLITGSARMDQVPLELERLALRISTEHELTPAVLIAPHATLNMMYRGVGEEHRLRPCADDLVDHAAAPVPSGA